MDDAVGGLNVRGNHVGVVDLVWVKKKRYEGGREGEGLDVLSLGDWDFGHNRNEGREGKREGGKAYLDTAAGDGHLDGGALHGHGTGQLHDIRGGHTAWTGGREGERSGG